jgi:hypothetical protein
LGLAWLGCGGGAEKKLLKNDGREATQEHRETKQSEDNRKTEAEAEADKRRQEMHGRRARRHTEQQTRCVTGPVAIGTELGTTDEHCMA